MTEKKVPTNLPEGVLPEDLKYNDKAHLPYSAFVVGEDGVPELPQTLTFYQTQGFGWCLMTLEISRGKRGHADRSYGVIVGGTSEQNRRRGEVCRCGNGPHVTAVVTVWLNTENAERLKGYVAMWKKGMADAGMIRDRISTRRAKGQQMRAEGRTRWQW
jgi:hypothetical protein